MKCTVVVWPISARGIMDSEGSAMPDVLCDRLVSWQHWHQPDSRTRHGHFNFLWPMFSHQRLRKVLKLPKQTPCTVVFSYYMQGCHASAMLAKMLKAFTGRTFISLEEIFRTAQQNSTGKILWRVYLTLKLMCSPDEVQITFRLSGLAHSGCPTQMTCI